jgi:hypothetical protein
MSNLRVSPIVLHTMLKKCVFSYDRYFYVSEPGYLQITSFYRCSTWGQCFYPTLANFSFFLKVPLDTLAGLDLMNSNYSSSLLSGSTYLYLFRFDDLIHMQVDYLKVFISNKKVTIGKKIK